MTVNFYADEAPARDSPYCELNYRMNREFLVSFGQHQIIIHSGTVKKRSDVQYLIQVNQCASATCVYSRTACVQICFIKFSFTDI